jgi:hypothetical protein
MNELAGGISTSAWFIVLGSFVLTATNVVST